MSHSMQVLLRDYREAFGQPIALSATAWDGRVRLRLAKVGIAPATLCRWLKLSEFKAAYRQARRQIVETALGRLQQATDKAVEALERNLTCGHPESEIPAAGLGERFACQIDRGDDRAYARWKKTGSCQAGLPGPSSDE